MPGGSEHLRNHVFHQHAGIKRERVEHQFFIKAVVFDCTFAEGVTDEKSGVGHVAFHRRTVFIESQANIGGRGGEAAINNFGVGEPEEGVGIVAHSGFFFEGRQPERFVVLLKLSRQLVKNLSDVVFLSIGILTDVVTVEPENGTFLFVRFQKITGTDEDVYRLRHSADDQILTKEIHCFAVQTAWTSGCAALKSTRR